MCPEFSNLDNDEARKCQTISTNADDTLTGNIYNLC